MQDQVLDLIPAKASNEFGLIDRRAGTVCNGELSPGASQRPASRMAAWALLAACSRPVPARIRPLKETDALQRADFRSQDVGD